MKCKPKYVTLKCFQMTEETQKNNFLWPSWLRIGDQQDCLKYDKTINTYYLNGVPVYHGMWIMRNGDELYAIEDYQFKRDFDLIPDY